MKRYYAVTAAIGGLLLLGACDAPSSSSASGGGHVTHSDSDLACTHFRNIMGDAAQGILTDSELRKKLQEVNSDASIASPAVQAGATHMLSAATAGDPGRLMTATQETGTACKADGY